MRCPRPPSPPAILKCHATSSVAVAPGAIGCGRRTVADGLRAPHERGAGHGGRRASAAADRAGLGLQVHRLSVHAHPCQDHAVGDLGGGRGRCTGRLGSEDVLVQAQDDGRHLLIAPVVDRDRLRTAEDRRGRVEARRRWSSPLGSASRRDPGAPVESRVPAAKARWIMSVMGMVRRMARVSWAEAVAGSEAAKASTVVRAKAWRRRTFMEESWVFGNGVRRQMPDISRWDPRDEGSRDVTNAW